MGAIRTWLALPPEERLQQADVAAFAMQSVIPGLIHQGRVADAMVASDAIHAPKVVRSRGRSGGASVLRQIEDPDVAEYVPDTEDAEARTAFRTQLALSDRLPQPLADIARLQAAADAAGPIVEYYVGQDLTVAFVLRRGAPVTARTIPIGFAALQVKVERLRVVAANPGMRLPGELEEAAASLGADLFGPIADLLPTGGTLVIVPHGPLHLAPFALLPTPSGVAAHERWHLSQVSSVAALDASTRRSRRGPAGAVLVAAHPDVQFPKLGLPGVREVPLDPPAVLAAAASARSLVVASVGAVTPGEVSQAWLNTRTGEHWQATQIAAERLDLDLVVLPVCDSAAGRATVADDRFNLVQAFTTAGVRAVAATLWQIPDTAANSKFVETFLAGWGQGQRPDEALEGARRWAISTGLGPEVWAAWTLIGDGR